MAKLTKQSSHYYCSRTERNIRALSSNKNDPPPKCEPLRRNHLRNPPRTPAPPNISYFPQMARPNTKSLLDLPLEIRLLIYRLLLYTYKPITYGICLECQSIVSRKKWKQHHLYPAILETCKLINAEGTTILYGENLFSALNQLEVGMEDVIASWRTSTLNLERITHFSTSVAPMSCPFLGDKLAYTFQQIDRFKHLKSVRILTRLEFEEWSELIRTASTKLGHIKRIGFQQQVDFQSHYGLIRRNKEAKDINFKKEHLKTHMEVLREQGLFEGRKRVAVKYCEPPGDPYWDEGFILVAVE